MTWLWRFRTLLISALPESSGSTGVALPSHAVHGGTAAARQIHNLYFFTRNLIDTIPDCINPTFRGVLRCCCCSVMLWIYDFQWWNDRWIDSIVSPLSPTRAPLNAALSILVRWECGIFYPNLDAEKKLLYAAEVHFVLSCLSSDSFVFSWFSRFLFLIETRPEAIFTCIFIVVPFSHFISNVYVAFRRHWQLHLSGSSVAHHLISQPVLCLSLQFRKGTQFFSSPLHS